MPSRKQRRRQQKARRHEYEYVYVDDEGREVEVDPADVEVERRAPKSQSKTRNSGRGSSSRTIRTVQPPSWRRTLRRAGIFAPFLLIVIWLTSKNTAPGARILIALVYAALLIPFLYFADTLAYRAYRRRLDRDAARR